MNVPVGLLTHNATQTHTALIQKHDIENLQCRAILLASVENQNAFFFGVFNCKLQCDHPLSNSSRSIFVLLVFLRGWGMRAAGELGEDSEKGVLAVLDGH